MTADLPMCRAWTAAITPANVHVTLFGDVKLGDFGVATGFHDTRLTQRHSSQHTPASFSNL